MLIVLTLLSFLLHTNALPTSFGPVTTPTIAHDIIFGRQTQCDCTGIIHRTLFDIVRSCLLTIAACVYRAVHQNIPNPNATWGQRMWIRIKITLLALFAPEMMIWWAMKQWMAARMIRNRVIRYYPELQWTLTHGYFLQMGGFIREDNGHVLLLNEILSLLENRQIDIRALRKVTKKEIDDHSKGDLISKALVTLQTTWFVFECITRWHQKLLLTELEVVTLAFAVLNMLTYGFWWYKPLDVLCPIRVIVHDTPVDPNPTVKEAEEGQEGDTDNADDTEQSRLVATEPSATPKQDTSVFKACLAFLAYPFVVILDGFKFWGKEIANDFRDSGWLGGSMSVIGVPFAGVLELVSNLFETETLTAGHTHVPTFYAAEFDTKEWSLVLCVSCFIGMIFGAIHFLSWDSHFPTHLESLLWRISSVVLVVEPFLIIAVHLLIEGTNKAGDGVFGDFMAVVAIVCGFFSSAIGPLCYVLARACLLFLAFLTLQHLPSEVFETVSWTSYIPHL